MPKFGGGKSLTILCTASRTTLRRVPNRDALETVKEAVASGKTVCNHYFSQPSSILAVDLLRGLEVSETTFCLYEDEKGKLHFSTENLMVEALDKEGQRLEGSIAVDGGRLERRMSRITF